MRKLKFPSEIILPIICIIVGVILIGFVTVNYISENEKMNWTTIEATTTDMDSVERSGGGRRFGGRTLYLITYSYVIDGTEYTNTARLYHPIAVGENIQIKYNPNEPSSSTTLQKPNTKTFVIALVLGVVLIASGVLFTAIIWKNRFIFVTNSSDAEDKPYYHNPNDKAKPTAYLKLLIPIGVFVIAMVLMYFQPFAQKSLSPNEFNKIMASEGYQTENSLERLQTEFGMGSLITESCSVNTDELRIDFCVLNTSRNAQLLYDSAKLPANIYVITDKKFVATENDEVFCLKTIRNQTFVYGACKPEQKNELLDLLREMNYYNE